MIAEIIYLTVLARGLTQQLEERARVERLIEEELSSVAKEESE